jgi:hypothetical protein
MPRAFLDDGKGSDHQTPATTEPVIFSVRLEDVLDALSLLPFTLCDDGDNQDDNESNQAA